MFKIKALLYCFLGFVILFFWSENAVCALERDFQTWFNLTATGKFHSKSELLNQLQFWLEGQERLGDDSSRATQTMVRPGIGYSLNETTSIWIGYAWVHTGAPNAPTPFEENRIWQQLIWVKPLKGLTLSTRTRTEQRFLENAPKTAYRLRQLFKISIPWKEDSKLSFVSSNEIFWHKNNFVGNNSQGFDQNRLFVGWGYKFNSVAATEIGYMNQYIRRFGVPNFLANTASINFFLSL